MDKSIVTIKDLTYMIMKHLDKCEEDDVIFFGLAMHDYFKKRCESIDDKLADDKDKKPKTISAKRKKMVKPV